MGWWTNFYPGNGWKWPFPSAFNWLFGVPVPGFCYTIHNITLEESKKKKTPLAPGSEAIKATPVTGIIKGKIEPGGGATFPEPLLFDFITFGSKQPGKQKEDTVQDSFVFFHGSPVNGCKKSLKTFVLMCPLRIIGPSSHWRHFENPGPPAIQVRSPFHWKVLQILRVERQNEGTSPSRWP